MFSNTSTFRFSSSQVSVRAAAPNEVSRLRWSRHECREPSRGGDHPSPTRRRNQGALLWPGQRQWSRVHQGQEHVAWPPAGLQCFGAEETCHTDTTEPSKFESRNLSHPESVYNQTRSHSISWTSVRSVSPVHSPDRVMVWSEQVSFVELKALSCGCQHEGAEITSSPRLSVWNLHILVMSVFDFLNSSGYTTLSWLFSNCW